MFFFFFQGVNVKVTALINDTVGTLVAHAYTNPNARVGFIYGTGVNAAYPEKTSAMVKLDGASHSYSQDTSMLVNTEIDIFGSDAYLPLNKYDRELDANHSQPEFQLYEKMMSGACIGELVRLACLDLIKEGQLFNGHRPEEFSTAMEFGTAVTSDVEG
jgi:hexokinase